jgi:aerobic carbon-monoxide dehydrogenase medium subunit
MKLPAFDYAVPTSVDEAVKLLAEHPGAKPLAGGQSLLPTMAFRLAAPAMLVDLRRIDGLGKIEIGETHTGLGARVRWRDILDDARLKAAQPLLVEAVSHVAHYQIRNRGTVGGSLAHADPAAELPGIAVACDAQIVTRSPRGERIFKAERFFTGALSTALADDELIVALRLPAWPRSRRWAFQEFSRRRGDFALAGVAVYYDLEERGQANNAHVGVIGACTRPHRVGRAEDVLNGKALNHSVIVEAAQAMQGALEPPGDLHASAAYRRSLAGALLERALERTL